MIDRLTLIAPGDSRPDTGPALVLLDGREYPAEVFAPVAREVEAGAGVECRPGARGPVFVLRHPERVEGVRRLDAHVLFFAGTDTDVKTQAPVARMCDRATFIVQPGQDESAARALEKEQFAFWRNAPGAALPKADVALLSSDWSIARREFIRRCRRAGVPTISLQEAVNVDFDGPPHRMRWADAVCVSGPHALKYLQRDVSFLTGNPRFDGYEATPSPRSSPVLINCNFILSLGGERGPGWMKQVLDVVRNQGFAYRVTKHPRDDTDLAGVEHVLPSGAYSIREQLAECSVLVTRDSSLAYEALLLGRPVVYFDPYHEKERTLREDESGLIRKCDTVEGLRNALRNVTPNTPASGYDPYMYHFTEAGRGAAERTLRALASAVECPDLCHTADARVDAGVGAAVREWAELKLRPSMRRIGPLRRVWRAARRMTG